MATATLAGCEIGSGLFHGGRRLDCRQPRECVAGLALDRCTTATTIQEALVKTLMLMRHAKSDWGPDFGSDVDRPLNGRGVRSARLMGRILAANGKIPDLVISSPAVRARTTTELAKESGSWDVSIMLDSRLYEMGPDGVMETASQAPDVDRLMLVGHEPTWSSVVTLITGEPVEMKTAVVAVVELPIERWSEIGAGIGRLAEVYRPRDHEGGG